MQQLWRQLRTKQSFIAGLSSFCQSKGTYVEISTGCVVISVYWYVMAVDYKLSCWIVIWSLQVSWLPRFASVISVIDESTTTTTPVLQSSFTICV